MVLPPTATFCGKCGERLKRSTQYTNDISSIGGQTNLEKYRITSLIQRIPYVQLSLAMDIQQQRPVVIRDIDIQQIDISSRSRIFEALQQEYDLLRQQTINDVLPLVSSFHTQNHLYSISALPQKSRHGDATHIYTLEDLLQSGIGLPDVQVALNWILRLTHAIEHLHSNQLVIGTLDPSTILINQKDYSGQPTLFPSWMLPTVQSQLRPALNTTNAPPYLAHITTARTAFFSPEAKEGQPDLRSDIYSMAAILYLLVTGIAPNEQSITGSQQLRSPREINPRVQSTLATIILKALSRDPSARFDSVDEFAAALLLPETNKVPQRFYNGLLGHNRSAENAGTQLREINVTSDKDNNKTEQGKAVQAESEINETTIPITSIQTWLARRYLPRIKTPKLGQEQLASNHEESIVGNGDPEQTIQPAKEEIQQPQSASPATVAEVVSEPEDETSLQNQSDNLASVSQDEQYITNQQASSRNDTEDASRTETTGADTEENQQKLNDMPAVSSESNGEIPSREPEQQGSPALAIPTDIENTPSSDSNNMATGLSPLPSEVLEEDKRDPKALTKTFSVLLERIKRFVLGSQTRTNNAVAIIETPMRIQPNKNYILRIHIIGRNEPKHASGSKQNNATAEQGGLGSLRHRDIVHIEVRSALYHNYAYIVQQTDVEVPAYNYAAEVTIPMRSIITDISGIKRERLHIFFTDEQHNPLYEKPFLLELFISNLVQPGQEGHNVLSIPL